MACPPELGVYEPLIRIISQDFAVLYNCLSDATVQAIGLVIIDRDFLQKGRKFGDFKTRRRG